MVRFVSLSGCVCKMVGLRVCMGQGRFARLLQLLMVDYNSMGFVSQMNHLPWPRLPSVQSNNSIGASQNIVLALPVT